METGALMRAPMSPLTCTPSVGKSLSVAKASKNSSLAQEALHGSTQHTQTTHTNHDTVTAPYGSRGKSHSPSQKMLREDVTFRNACHALTWLHVHQVSLRSIQGLAEAGRTV